MPSNLCKKEKLDRIKKKLIKWDKAYFNGESIVPDEEYDKFKRLYEKHRPDDPYLQKVGADPKGSNAKKVKLPFVMPSLKKVYEDKGQAQAWLDKSSGKLLVTDKLDGVSFGMVSNKGKPALYTRGNGTVGQDVTKLLPHVNGVGRIQGKDKVRGELLVKQATFNERHSDSFENSRNMVSGIVNSKGVHNASTDVHMVAHEIIGMPWAKARVKLKSIGFDTVPTKAFNNPTVKQLDDYLKERKSKSKYELDGLVLIDTVTGNRIAFKANEEATVVEVDKVEWNLSSFGVYKPTVWFKKAVRLEGVNVRKATGHNASYIVSHKIGPGAKINVVRAGGVIPKVVGTVKGVKPQLPENFKWDANKVEALSSKLTNKQSFVIDSKILVRALEKIGVEGVKLKTAEKLVEYNFDLASLFNADLEEIEETGIGTVNSNKLYNALRLKKKTVSHSELMSASQCWPKGFSRDKFDAILEVVPFRELKSKRSQLPTIVGQIHGLSVDTGRKFSKYLPDYFKFLKELGWLPRSNSRTKKTVKGPLSGKSFCFTGFRDKNMEASIENKGGSITSLKKDTTALIVSDKNFNSSKTDKAEVYGVPVYTKAQAIKKFKLV